MSDVTTLPPATRRRDDGAQRSQPVAALPVRRERHLSVALVGVLVAAMSGLGFAVWGQSLGARHPVLVFARDVEAGQRIDAADVTEARIAAPRGVVVVSASRRTRVIGKIVLTKAYAGSLVQAAQLATHARLSAGTALVGVRVEPGDAPVPELRAGQRVQLVRTEAPGAGFSEDLPEVLVEAAVIETVTVPPESELSSNGAGRRFVSLRVPEPAAAEVVAAAAADRLRLVLVGP